MYLEPLQRAADAEVGNREDRYRQPDDTDLFDLTTRPEVEPVTREEMDSLLRHWKQLRVNTFRLLYKIALASQLNGSYVSIVM